MPFKTQHGSHYHMTYGCHGATIPCNADGLAPCSDCCGGTGAGAATGGNIAGAHAGGFPHATDGGGTSNPMSHVATRSTEQRFDASDDLRHEIVQAMVQAFASQAVMPEPRQPDTYRATYAHASQMRPNMPELGVQYDPQAEASRTLLRPQSAKAALATADETVRYGLSKKRMPLIHSIGDRLRGAIGNIQLAVSDRIRSQRLARGIRKAMRDEDCDEYTARCLVASHRESELARTQHDAAEYIRYQMTWSNASSVGRRVTAEDVVCNRMRGIGERTAERYGIRDTDVGSVSQTIALAHSIQNAIEEGGYADKITPRMVDRIKAERGLSHDECDPLTIAMEGAMYGHRFRADQARQVTSNLRRQRMMEATGTPMRQTGTPR